MACCLKLFNFQIIYYAKENEWLGEADTTRLLSDHQHEETEDLPSEHVPTSNLPNQIEGGESFDVHFQPESHSTIRVLLLVFALSLHSVFEGFSVGMIQEVYVLLQVRMLLKFQLIQCVEFRFLWRC